jgi:hypothetical protein
MKPQLQFTLDLENNKSINFLDLCTLRSDSELDFIIYRKPTYTYTTISLTLVTRRITNFLL